MSQAPDSFVDMMTTPRMRTGKDIVVGLDSGTTATKAIAWSADGAVLGQGRSVIRIYSPAPDWYEQNAEDWWRSACAALQQLWRKVDPGEVAAIAIACQRETFVPLGQNGEPVRPAIVWLDQRCHEEVAWLTDRVGGNRIHQITGKPPDIAPAVYRIAWMLRHEKERFRRTGILPMCMRIWCGGSPARCARAGQARTRWGSSIWNGTNGRPRFY